FGILAVAYVTACGGGIIRDVLIGAVPPAGLMEWRYLATAMIAAAITIVAYRRVEKLTHPVRLFDAMGLALFAVYGAHKALLLGHNAEVAIIVGMVTAIGGGMLRDVLLNRVSLVLQQEELYATVAFLTASLAVAGEYLGWPALWSTWLPIVSGFVFRWVSLRRKWVLPTFNRKE
ncbi:MAG TPA: TRIC cation channel family protein, partial [Wenzhouxiangella sp.]|nr:TRIC cation channel family protein [Wenzhouxiangella sp.]